MVLLSLFLSGASVYPHHPPAGTVTHRREALGNKPLQVSVTEEPAAGGGTQPWHRPASPGMVWTNPSAQRSWLAAHGGSDSTLLQKPWVEKWLGQCCFEDNFRTGSRAHGLNPLLHLVKAFKIQFNADLKTDKIWSKGNGKTGTKRASLLSTKAYVSTHPAGVFTGWNTLSAATSDSDRLWHIPSNN